MAESKNEDVQFDVAELTSTDPETADKAREKRNSPAPESIRGDLDKTSWPVPEGQKPAVMRADTEADHDYQLETYSKVDADARESERTGGPGSHARTAARKEINKLSDAGKGLDEFQAPPGNAAKAESNTDSKPKGKAKN